ncbi:uncharacterized protein LOC127808206 [Diospyros lotus]|uniref:uncharacterized protein LOC127808206 n=1 Tax=Diospyros lotus TaxID=55363 RepID=UPI0022579CDE|nr:uncharacterized protein LOC127808206 [Diospyros lotus]
MSSSTAALKLNGDDQISASDNTCLPLPVRRPLSCRSSSGSSISTPPSVSSSPIPSFSSISFSSLGSSSSSFHDDLQSPLFSPPTPTTSSSPHRFSAGGGIPFSWEQLPGIPKKQLSKNNKEPSLTNLLPLPPAPARTSSTRQRTSSSSKTKIFNQISPIGNKYSSSSSSSTQSIINVRRDPFFAALVECSKDDDDHHHGQETITAALWKPSKISTTLSDRFGFVTMYTSCKRSCSVSNSVIYIPRPRPR